ncbi:MAG: NAD-dependent DNA ligase LigA [bacterium]|nr:NAD-dependent DNA ligase LigA [bacterium]
MDKSSAKKRIIKLREEIEYHRHLYHVLDKQEISDSALDSLKHELYGLEQQFPDLITKDSPTQRVGGEPLKEFKEVQHQSQMLSLEDVFLAEELTDWEERNRKIFPQGKYNYYCELKIDGLAIELRYRDGVLFEASTRGDGKTGENVTENIKTIESIPLRIIGKAPKELTVRGEVYMNQDQFDALNKEQEKLGKPLYANPRNVAAGSIRQLDSKITASRKLHCVTYDIVDDQSFAKHHEEHLALKKYGFRTSAQTEECADLAIVAKYHARWQQKRDLLPHWIDGVVVFIDDNETFRRLGVAGKTPRGAVAFKFPAEEATTVVEDILVQVGRTGALTPVAVLRPVSVAGTTVSRATLHNEDEIHRKDVRVGDTVVIHKAGDIIPEVVRVLPKLRPNKTKEFRMPVKCPICDARVEKEKDGAISRCTNKQCSAQQLEGLIHFVSRTATDMEGVGPKLIEKLVEIGLVRDSADLYGLKKTDVVSLERFAEKSADNVIESIQGRKNLSLGRFIYALGIQHVGNVTAVALAEKFSTLTNIQKASEEELSAVDGVGDVVGKSIYEFFQSKHAGELLKKFEKNGVVVEKAVVIKRTGIFSGKTVVVTGSLGDLTRDEVWEEIRKRGGKITETVSKKTGLLIVGEEPGSKVVKAQKLGVEIMDAKEFLKKIKE